jgi:hypothetical protein
MCSGATKPCLLTDAMVISTWQLMGKGTQVM